MAKKHARKTKRVFCAFLLATLGARTIPRREARQRGKKSGLQEGVIQGGEEGGRGRQGNPGSLQNQRQRRRPGEEIRAMVTINEENHRRQPGNFVQKKKAVVPLKADRAKGIRRWAKDEGQPGSGADGQGKTGGPTFNFTT